MEYTVLTQA